MMKQGGEHCHTNHTQTKANELFFWTGSMLGVAVECSDFVENVQTEIQL